MSRSAKEIASEIKKIISESLEIREDGSLEVGDFVLYQGMEWILSDTNGREAAITDPDGEEKMVYLNQLELSQKKLKEEDFEDMPMANPLYVDGFPKDELGGIQDYNGV